MPNRTPEEIRIKLEDCVKGRLYRFRARNFNLGVFDGKKGFIGIREKFGSRFLDTEYHWDADAHHGTVWAIEDTGIDLTFIQPQEDFGSQDTVTGRAVEWNEEKRWHFRDTGEASVDIRPARVSNTALFTCLNDYYMVEAREQDEKALTKECPKCKAAPGVMCTDPDWDLHGRPHGHRRV